MASDEEDQIIGVAEEPDLTDMEKVIFSIEQRDGAQFSLVVGRQAGMVLSLTSDHEGDMEEIMDARGVIVDTRFIGPQVWEFIIRLEEA